MGHENRVKLGYQGHSNWVQLGCWGHHNGVPLQSWRIKTAFLKPWRAKVNNKITVLKVLQYSSCTIQFENTRPSFRGSLMYLRFQSCPQNEISPEFRSFPGTYRCSTQSCHCSIVKCSKKIKDLQQLLSEPWSAPGPASRAKTWVCDQAWQGLLMFSRNLISS